MLQIPLSQQAEAVLRERAEAHGEDVVAYAARVLNEALTAPSVEELLAPFRRQIDADGASDDALDVLCEELRNEVWQEHQARKAKSA